MHKLQLLWISLIVVLGLISTTCFAQGQKDVAWLSPVVGEGYGVQVKEGDVATDELRMMRDAGLGYVRFVMPWYAVEQSRDRFDWSYFDRFVQKMREAGLKAVIVLGAGHPDYTGTIALKGNEIVSEGTINPAPADDAARAAFARYAAEAVRHFGATDIVWEIWNEPDQDIFWAPKANANDYAALANEACWAMRKVEPSVRIVGPATAETPGHWGALIPGFMTAILKSTVADCFDALSVHPYRDRETPPETVGAAYEKFRAFIAAQTPTGRKNLSFLSTEWGFPTTEVTEYEQAAYLLRTYLLNTLHGVPLSIWYEWRDSRDGANDPEAHFGLLDRRRRPKEAYLTLKSFLPPLVGAKLEKRLEVGNPEDYVLWLQHPVKGHSLVYWTSDPQGDTNLMIRCEEGAIRGQEIRLTTMPQRVDCGATVPDITAVHYRVVK
ncbi:MAG: beta-galactosidase [Alphaproteobacteria bacterium]|jgi:hypothetical protein|nr:beta-galactosidase [Alphaproteobacteria bacterium]